MKCRTHKPGGGPQSALVRSLTFVRDDRARSQRDDFTQHSHAIAKKTNFASFSVIPAHRNFTDSQSGMLREITQCDLQRESVKAGGLQNWPTHSETKSLEPALRIPKRQASRDAYEQVERAASLFTS